MRGGGGRGEGEWGGRGGLTVFDGDVDAFDGGLGAHYVLGEVGDCAAGGYGDEVRGGDWGAGGEGEEAIAGGEGVRGVGGGGFEVEGGWGGGG